MEFTDAQDQPNKPSAKAFQQACLSEKAPILTCGTYDNIVRVIAPMMVSAEQIEDALARFGLAMAAVYGG
jgi:4-aminobutyrate aminotransferase